MSSEPNQNSSDLGRGSGGLRDVTNNPNSRKDRLALLEQWRKQANSRQQVAAATAASLSTDTVPCNIFIDESVNDVHAVGTKRPNSAPFTRSVKRQSLLGESNLGAENCPNALEVPISASVLSSPSPMGATARFRLAREERMRMKQQEGQPTRQYVNGAPPLPPTYCQSPAKLFGANLLPPHLPNSSHPIEPASLAVRAPSPSRITRSTSKSRGRRSSLGGGALSSSNIRDVTPKRPKSRRMSVNGLSSGDKVDMGGNENIVRPTRRSRRLSMLPGNGENIQKCDNSAATLPPRISAPSPKLTLDCDRSNSNNLNIKFVDNSKTVEENQDESSKIKVKENDIGASVKLTDLKSRLEEMQCCIDTLEKEKMELSMSKAPLEARLRQKEDTVNTLEKEKLELSMSKAPLEARLRQKEDTWAKDRAQLVQEYDSLKNSAKIADEKYRSTEMQNNALQEEISRYKLECLKAGLSSSQKELKNDAWSRQVQTDREVSDLKEKLRHAVEENKGLKIEKVSVESQLMGTNLELDSLFKRHYGLQEEFTMLEANKTAARDAVIQLETLTTEHTATSAHLNAVSSDLAATKSSSDASIKLAREKWEDEKANLLFEIQVLKEKGRINDDINNGSSASPVDDVAVLRARNLENQNRISELEIQCQKNDQLRRKMHNVIQELRGNIRVFVRTRPFLPGDGNPGDSAISVLSDGENMSICDRGSQKISFKFDKIFGQSAGQDQVFDEVSDFVQSAMDGYNVCLFSYGQTGSGKTHTMQGSGKSAMRGIIPRSVEQILSQAAILQNQNWKFTINASFLEIYNENLRDLLLKGSSKQSSKLSIKRDSNGKSYIDGLSKVRINTASKGIGLNQLETVIATAARTRSVASTNMNSQSSRSHSIFMLHLHGYNDETKTSVDGSLNLCDLAGSERLDRSGAASNAQRLKETQAINKSLSCLGDVFNALATGASHVPYRNSKLTYLLQDCLSGDGKALMFVNLSPTIESSHESVCSLKFAQRVNKVELGKPIKHMQRCG